MKIKIFFPLLFITAFLQCHKEKPNPSTELPPVTQEGKNTFGFKVNGEVWVPFYRCGGSGNPCGEMVVRMIRTSSNQAPVEIHIGAAIKYKDNTISSFSINSPVNQGVSSVGDKIDSVDLEYIRPGIIQYIEIPGMAQNNKFIVTKLDTVNNIISGTFEATLYSSLTDSVKITEGRFDLKFSVCKCSN